MTNCPARAHGKVWHVNRLGCICPDAREKARLYRKRHRNGRQRLVVDATGTRRRLQALSRLGHTVDAIVAYAPASERTIRAVMNGSSNVLRSIAATVAATYDALSMTPGPSYLTAAKAKKRGWLPPLAWDDDTIDDPNARPDLGDDDSGAVDDIAVEAAVAGSPIRLTRQVDQIAAINILTRLGRGPQEIALQLGMKPGTVSQLKHRHLKEVAA